MSVTTARELQAIDNQNVAGAIRKVVEVLGMPKVGAIKAGKALDEIYENYDQPR